MPRIFELVEGPHAPQLCIQAHDLTRAECERLRWIICDNHTLSENYKNVRPSQAFLQGFQLPYGDTDGWVLVEFWGTLPEDRPTFEHAVAYINRKMNEPYPSEPPLSDV